MNDDARRRDLTINALYYDTVAQTLIDKMDGQADVAARIIRIIGAPADRYREDPVRMVRVLRFAARLEFDIEPRTRSAIAETGTLLRDIPAARLFDEWLKLFMNGFSAPTCALLREHGLLTHLMGDGVDAAHDTSAAQLLQHQAMTNTDRRVAEDRPVTPAFLLAALFWPATEQRADQLVTRGESPLQAMHSAGQQIVQEACQHLAIPKRFSFAMRDIWDLQPRLERRQPKKVKDLLAHRWFRAAFDLRLLREASGDEGDECSAFGAHNSSNTPNSSAVNRNDAKTKADVGRDRGAGNPRHESRCYWPWFQHRGAADATGRGAQASRSSSRCLADKAVTHLFVCPCRTTRPARLL